METTTRGYAGRSNVITRVKVEEEIRRENHRDGKTRKTQCQLARFVDKGS